MEPDSRERLSALFHAALARRPEERRAFLQDECRGDSALLAEVASLLEHQSAASQWLDMPAAVIAGAAQATSMVGRQLGPYAITMRVGAGGMGEVYRARDTRLGRDVAIKVAARSV